MKSLVLFLCAALFFSACSSTKNIDIENDQAAAVMVLDHRDFTSAAGTLVKSLMDSRALDRADRERYVVAISRIKNDTMQRIDTDQLIRKIRRDMMKSGKAVISTAVTAGGGAEDQMNYESRELRSNPEFNQATVQEQGQLIAPELSLHGKIFQRNFKLDNGDKQVEYYFTLTLTDLRTGISKWEDEVVMGKRGDGKSATW